MFAPATKGLPWNWESRREAILSRPDRVLEAVIPLGYAAVFAATEHRAEDDWLAKMSEQQELAYLISTQNQDIAPEWRVLMENGISAFSKDGSSAPDGSDDADISIELADESDTDPTIYIRPTRRELWWMEEDHYRWKCGPTIRAEYYQREDGKRGLRVVGRSGLSPARENEWLQHLSAYDAEHGLKPAPHTIQPARAELRGRVEHYGREWLLSILTDEELEAVHAQQTLNHALDILDSDVERNAFKAEDALREYRADRPGYAGEGDLGTTVWDGVADISFWQEHDMEPSLLPL